MDPILVSLLSLVLTLATTVLLSLFLKTALQRVLLDLCSTAERARFWTLFSMILLIATPCAVSLGFTPQESSGPMQYFELLRQLRGNMLTFLFMLGVVGGFLSLFAMFAPRPQPASE